MAEPDHSDFSAHFTKWFSAYRAENLQGDVFRLFTQPSYFPQLEAANPCFLVGGRGTGKTTALRGLSYQGQTTLDGRAPLFWAYYGFYHRINANRVTAFAGPERQAGQWLRLFAHYVNLELCELVAAFLNWFSTAHPEAEQLDQRALARICASLGVPTVEQQRDLQNRLAVARLTFEAEINNIASDEVQPKVTLQGAPIDTLLMSVKALPHFADKLFFFLIDEYENLDAEQQRVYNTLIKHCGEYYSFKVGVKETGFIERRTLIDAEQLSHPADYKLINISDQLERRFDEFASAVCMARLRRAASDEHYVRTVKDWFPELSDEEEAMLLGVGPKADEIVERLRAEGAPKALLDKANRLHPLEMFVAAGRASAEGKALAGKMFEVVEDETTWKVQYQNYKFAYLFHLKKGKGGIRKYFCGWNTLCALAACNIRYLLELVDQAITLHLADNGDQWAPVSASNQTRAAQASGRRNLRELEGLALSGAQLTRLVLGLGRVMQVMAESPIGHTAEATQFELVAADPGQLSDEAVALVRQGVMHLALIRYQSSKPQDQNDLKHFDYALHPIFSAFFGFSHRRKRKFDLSDTELMKFVTNPQQAIDGFLKRQNRVATKDLPEQMGLFGSYYGLQDQ